VRICTDADMYRQRAAEVKHKLRARDAGLGELRNQAGPQTQAKLWKRTQSAVKLILGATTERKLMRDYATR
jgi:hypothetical protein